MKAADRVACAALLAAALAGPCFLPVVTRRLDPALAVSVAWERSGSGAVVAPVESRPTGEDPWGRPFVWKSYRVAIGCEVLDGWAARSQGPSPEDPTDDVEPTPLSGFPTWRRAPVEHPAVVSLGLALWVGLAGTLLRHARRRPLPAEGALALGAALPAAPAGWWLAHTERLADLALPPVVPPAVAVGLSALGLAVVVALAVRLTSRPEAA
ncbi:MAG: hypothetical protein KF878_29235 [Planctomycetes bacterium]|nr:hypothetical protein [Planctomycetota bacterium]